MRHANLRTERDYRGEAGVYLVLLTGVTFVILMLAGAMIASSYLGTNQTKLQNAADMAALGALAKFVQTKNNDFLGATFEARNYANAILQKNSGNNLGGKTLLGLSAPLADPANSTGLERAEDPDVIHNATGKLQFGEWLVHDPNPQSLNDPCDLRGGYPCFYAHDDQPGGIGRIASAAPNTININAVRVIIDRAPRVNIPLAGAILNYAGNRPKAIATATVVQRCVAMLMDLSDSTVSETHHLDLQKIFIDEAHLPAAQRTYLPQSQNMGLFALQVSNLVDVQNNRRIACGTGTTAGRNTWKTIVNPPHARYFENRDAIALCDMIENGRVHRSTPNKDVHYLSDYFTHPEWVVDYFTATNSYPPFSYARNTLPWNSTDLEPANSIHGDLIVDRYSVPSDRYWGAEPMSSFFSAFNVGLRALIKNGSGDDRAMLIGFRGLISQGEAVPSTGLSQDLDLLVQLTNVKNRGALPPIQQDPLYPNFVDMAFTPMLIHNQRESTATNHAQALNEAINRLGDTDFCPSTAQKAIILATDGLATCTGTPADCTPTYETYTRAEAELLTEILPRLQASEISLTVLLDGAHVGPNFINHELPPQGSGQFVKLAEALKYGKHGMNMAINPPVVETDPAKALFATSSLPQAVNCPEGAIQGLVDQSHPNFVSCRGWASNFVNGGIDNWAFLNAGAELSGFNGPPDGQRVEFRRVNALWGEMALQTQGIYCPLMPVCDAGNCPAGYDSNGDLDPACRPDGSVQTCSIRNRTKGQQAAECILQALGDNPFVLSEDNSHL